MQIYEKLPLHFKEYFCRFTFFLFVTLLSLNWFVYLVGWSIVYLYFYVFVCVVVELSWLFGWLVECVRGEFKLKERISDLGQSHYQLRVCQSSSSL